MPVYQFQHLGGARCAREREQSVIKQKKTVIPLGLEPRTLSLKVRCSNRLSYEILLLCPAFGAAKIEDF